MSVLRKRRLPDAQVLVVGAGPVGMFTALRLAQRGVEVVLIEQSFSPARHAYGLALHPSTLEIFEEAGIASLVLRHARQVNRLVFFDEHEPRASISLTPLSDRFGFLASIGQNLLEAQLMSALEQVGVRLVWCRHLAVATQNDRHVTVYIDRLGEQGLGFPVPHTASILEETERYSFPFVVGADGYDSVVRTRLGLDFRRCGPTEHYIIGEFDEVEVGHDLRIALSQGTMNALWPLREGRCRWSVSVDEDASHASRIKERSVCDSEDVDPSTRHELVELVRERAPWYKESLEKLSWAKLVRFDRRLANRFGIGRVWLAGDAAHMAAPLAIQSLNIGLQEADRLAEFIAHALSSGTTTCLDAYESERQAEWRILNSDAQTLLEGRKLDPWAAQHFERIFRCLPINAKQAGMIESLFIDSENVPKSGNFAQS